MKLIIAMIIYLASFILAFPYAVSEDVLSDVKKYETAYAAQPSSNEVIFELAMAYAYSGQVKEGLDKIKLLKVDYADVVISKYSGVRLKNEKDWKSSFKLGFAYYFKKDKTKAIELFRESFDRNPKNVWPLGYMALVYGEMGNVDEAIRICHQALKIEKNATGIHFLLADAYKIKKKYMKAMKHILIVAKLQGSK
jgi:tetratricopeptide (TPR) repeat protein